MSRALAYGGLFVLLTLNAVLPIAIRVAEQDGWLPSIASLGGTSAIVWVALAAGVKLLHDDTSGAPLRRCDGPVAIVAGIAALLPSSTASSVALTGVALIGIATSRRGMPLRRAGVIFVALAGAILWGRVMLALFSRPVLDVDTMFVAGLLGAEHVGNMAWLATNPSGRVVVSTGCSSLQGISLAVLFWVTVNQLFAVRLGRRAIVALAAAVAVTIAINVLRIGALLRFPEHFHAIHEGWGAVIAMWATLLAVVAICLAGVGRDALRAG